MQNDREKILAGLAEMLGGSFRFEKELFKILQDASPLEGHPFGLDMTMRLSGIAWPNAERICLVSCPGWTDGSVKALAAVALDAAAYSVESIRYVRIIESYHEMGKHNLFFEIGTHNGTFIAGGCNDFSGEASSGTERLECLFAFLSLVYGVEVERVIIPAPQSHRAVEAIWAAYNAAHDQRNGSAA